MIDSYGVQKKTKRIGKPKKRGIKEETNKNKMIRDEEEEGEVHTKEDNEK
jgi:hypothetical protein